ncbi:MAG: glycosyltransferase family 87 protein [Nitrospiraceae bacterium]|nr:glycosyltransferase family 87 protein [Nitrospiraceae bacterium]
MTLFNKYPPIPRSASAFEPLNGLQRTGILTLLLFALIFGGIVELRGALQNTRKTDLKVYVRAAWSARAGEDLYSTTDESGWHYVYPPLFALLMTPLAEPPSWQRQVWHIPFAVSVGLWYILTMLLGIAGVHNLATALEEDSPNPAVRALPRFCQRWWALRIMPLLILLPAIGRSQMRGQVGLVIAWLLCGAAAALIRGRRYRAGLWLAASICIKIIPAFLLLFPAWRRDLRMTGGSLTGLALGLAAVPLLFLGPQKTLDAYQSFYQETLVAGVTGSAEGSRGTELTGITSTDSNSPMVVMHNLLHPFENPRPKAASPAVHAAHWALAAVLSLVTLLAAGWTRGPWRQEATAGAASREALFFGALILLMMTGSPVFHPHYVSMALPLITVLLAVLWDRYPYPSMSRQWAGLFLCVFTSHVLTSIGGALWFLRDFGLVLLSTLLLWAGCIALLRKSPRGSRDLQASAGT